MCRTPSILDSGLFYDKAGGTPGMYSQVVEVPKYKEKTTTTGIDRHISSGHWLNKIGPDPETGSREQTRQA